MPDPTDPEDLARRSRLAQAADDRARRADWDQLGAEEATLASRLERLAADGRAVRLSTLAGTGHGRVGELGPDHVRLVDRGRWRQLRLSAITTMEAGEATAPGVPERMSRTFSEALSRRAGEQVSLALADGTTVTGTLTAVGADVVTMARDGAAEPIYVSSSAVLEARGDGSG